MPTSAAETTITNSANACPVMSAGVTNRDSATRFRLTAIDMSSSDISTVTALFFEAAP